MVQDPKLALLRANIKVFGAGVSESLDYLKKIIAVIFPLFLCDYKAKKFSAFVRFILKWLNFHEIIFFILFIVELIRAKKAAMAQAAAATPAGTKKV